MPTNTSATGKKLSYPENFIHSIAGFGGVEMN